MVAMHMSGFFSFYTLVNQCWRLLDCRCKWLRLGLLMILLGLIGAARHFQLPVASSFALPGPAFCFWSLLPICILSCSCIVCRWLLLILLPFCFNGFSQAKSSPWGSIELTIESQWCLRLAASPWNLHVAATQLPWDGPSD